MASTSSPGNNPYHVRSISLPSRSHPLSLRVEEGLHMLKTWAASSLLSCSPTADLLCVGLQALEEMHDCVAELFRLPQTQKALARHYGEKWAAEELDCSLRLLDICCTTRDAISSMKEQAQGLQSVLRTRKRGEHLTVESKLRAFVQSRKEAHKDSSRCLKTLKQMEGRRPASPITPADQDLSLALRALKDLREITIIVFRSVSSLLSKPRRWQLPTSRGREEQNTSELAKVDASLRSISGKDAGFQKAEESQRRLQRLEAEMGSLETGLESLFRRLIQDRVSLLNIFTL